MSHNKVLVLINEQHSLMPAQEEILKEKFGQWEFVKVPATGWTIDKMKNVAQDLYLALVEAKPAFPGAKNNKIKAVMTSNTEKHNTAIVFVSPIPYLLAKAISDVSRSNFCRMKELTRLSVTGVPNSDVGETYEQFKIYVFHRDRREKTESNGVITTTVSNDSWQLV